MDIDIKEFLKEHKRVPILIFDEVWLKRFSKTVKSHKIKSLEKKLKNAIIEEANATSIDKTLKNKKEITLNEILLHSEKVQSDITNKSFIDKMSSLQKTIININTALNKNQEKIDTLPGEIEKLNLLLLEETIKICYNFIRKSEDELEILEPMIDRVRQDLRELINESELLKEKGRKYINLLNDLVGKDIMDHLSWK